jgi:hypothetical protein
VQRTHLGKRDLDWLPPSFKAVRWTTAGVVWTGMAALTAASFWSGSGDAVAGMGKSLIVAGYYAGDRAARAVLRMRLAKLARGQVELARLRNEADGELLHVRGRVRARTTLNGLLSGEPGVVYRRARFHLRHTLVIHEAAVDFDLVDERNESIIVQVEGSRLVGPEPRARRFSGAGAHVDRILALPLPPESGRWIKERQKRIDKGKKPVWFKAAEYLMRDGDELDVLGYKSRVVDASVESRLERDTPMRATLRAGRELPLILAPVRRR